jgi:class 3 adenylate cyclase
VTAPPLPWPSALPGWYSAARWHTAVAPSSGWVTGSCSALCYPDPSQAVLAALSIVERVAEAGLPPAHIGLHAGPLLFQEGDYYGQTVNVAARIGEYARPGEVLVSQDVVDESAGQPVDFREIGPVELKGVAGVIRLHQALRPA